MATAARSGAGISLAADVPGSSGWTQRPGSHLRHGRADTDAHDRRLPQADAGHKERYRRHGQETTPRSQRRLPPYRWNCAALPRRPRPAGAATSSSDQLDHARPGLVTRSNCSSQWAAFPSAAIATGRSVVAQARLTATRAAVARIAARGTGQQQHAHVRDQLRRHPRPVAVTVAAVTH